MPAKVTFLIVIFALALVGVLLAKMAPDYLHTWYRRITFVRGIIGAIVLVGWSWVLWTSGLSGMIVAGILALFLGIYLHFEKPSNTAKDLK